MPFHRVVLLQGTPLNSSENHDPEIIGDIVVGVLGIVEGTGSGSRLAKEGLAIVVTISLP